MVHFIVILVENYYYYYKARTEYINKGELQRNNVIYIKK